MMKLISTGHHVCQLPFTQNIQKNGTSQPQFAQPQFAGVLDGKIQLKLKTSDQKKLTFIQEKLGMTETEALSFVSTLSPGMDYFPSNENHTLYLMEKSHLEQTIVKKGSEGDQYTSHEAHLTADQFKDWLNNNLRDIATGKTWTEYFLDMVPFKKKSVDFKDGRHRDTAQVFYSCLLMYGLPLLAIVPRHDKRRVVKGIQAAFDALKQKEANPSLELVKVTIQPNYPKIEKPVREGKQESLTKFGLFKKIVAEMKYELLDRPAIESYSIRIQKVDLSKKSDC
jgi:hypothetical protein